jgi:hypothetical protein
MDRLFSWSMLVDVGKCFGRLPQEACPLRLNRRLMKQRF